MQRNFLIGVVFLSSVLSLSLPAGAQNSLASPQETQASGVGKAVVALIGTGQAAGKTVNFQMKTDRSSALSGAFIVAGSWRLSDQRYCNT